MGCANLAENLIATCFFYSPRTSGEICAVASLQVDDSTCNFLIDHTKFVPHTEAKFQYTENT